MNLRNGEGCLVGNLTAKFQLASCHVISDVPATTQSQRIQAQATVQIPSYQSTDVL